LDKILYLHKEYQAKHRKLKEELHRCEEVNETLESRIAELEDCEEQVGELRNHNRFLEKKVRELSTLSRPMDERDRYDRRLLLRQIEDTRNECDALMEENKVLRQKNLPLYPASNGEIATSKRELSNSPTDCRASPNLCDVWQQLDRAQQRCIQKDNELRQANNLLQAQVASNLTIRSEQGDSIAKLRRRLIAQECKTEDLSLKASRRLQQIRALESQFTKLHLNTRLGSSMEVTVHSAALHSLGKDTKSFLLLGFHPFASELSNIVSGREPAYDLRVTYELDDTKLSQWNVEVEIYVLNDASPRLFAHASVPMTTLLTSSASTQPLSLDLLREGGDGRVGKVNMSIRFHQPTPTDCPIPNDTMAIMECTGRKRTIKDAIYVSVMSVTLSNQLLFDDQSVFFVHYRLLSNGGVTTDSKMANIKGIITFNHKSSFSIVSTDEGCLEPILEEISKGTIQFTLLSIRKEDSTGDDTDVEDFHVVGEAKVPLTNIWNDVVELSTKLISLDEAKIVGSMGLSFVTTVKPRLPGSLRSTVHPSLMAMLTGVLSTIGEGESKTVSTIRLLQFIDPPEGIMETATILQRELRSNQLQGRSLSATLSLPPDEQFMSPSDLQRCSDAAHKKSLLAHIPPSDEMEDLYQYLSNSDSLICIRELDYFVASDSLKRLAYACRLLRGMNACIREDLLHNNVFGGRVDTFYDTMSVPELSEYYAKVLEGRSEVDLIRLASLLSEPSHPK
jgi:hypothetical protein